ncbi:hypothetical protein CMV_019961 [Castanea mollissima]|uniref:Uncharacterized protein n=1 Tax=Castanea mollissima TaxID=60419 RepID=A0A8J4QP04_9ROSI|nr:hypothetical protein CMV_019961 [Castanea mollissima]
MMAMGRKGGPRDTRPIDPMTGRIVTPEKPANADQSNDSKGEEDGGAGIKNFCFYLDIPQKDSVVLHYCLTSDNKSHLFWEGCKLCYVMAAVSKVPKENDCTKCCASCCPEH